MRWLELHEYVYVNGRPVEPEEMRRYADELAARKRRAEAERRGEKQKQQDRRRSS